MYHPVCIKTAGVSDENVELINIAVENELMFSFEREGKPDCIILDTVEVEG